MTPKILILTVESWNSKVGANTFSSLFAGYPAQNLANVYIREELPDSKSCARYFQISENKVIRSIFKPGVKTGREVSACQEMTGEDAKTLEATTQLYNKNRKKRSYFKLWVREILWKLGKWRTPELDAFVDSFQPDIVVFGMDSYVHFNRLCRHVVRRSGAKAIGYFWDDTFTYRQKAFSFGYWSRRTSQRISLKKLAKHCDAFWAITEKTKQEADAFFGIDCQVLTKPIDYAPDEQWQSYTPSQPVKMLYTGNLLIGRFETILSVSSALEVINAEGVKAELDVYTGSYIPPEDQAKLSEHVHMKGVVSQQEVLQLQKQADILLFAEAMTGEHSRIARLSFSTKLTDYLHSGKCILAAGAADVAPMEYLRKENAALCVSSEEELLQVLQRITADPELISRTACSGYACGRKNHSRDMINEKVTETFRKILGEEVTV